MRTSKALKLEERSWIFYRYATIFGSLASNISPELPSSLNKGLNLGDLEPDRDWFLHDVARKKGLRAKVEVH